MRAPDQARRVGRSRCLQTDPIEGGSANDYDYTDGDPVNGLDLDGTFPKIKFPKVVKNVVKKAKNVAKHTVRTIKRAARPVGRAVVTVGRTAYTYRSTILAVAGSVACTAATAGAGAAACTGITVAVLANATITTAAATRSCGWRTGLATGVFSYAGALPGGVAQATTNAFAVGAAGTIDASFTAVGDAGGIGQCE